MGKTKQLFEELQYEDVLGEEMRAYHHWMEQENYSRYPKREINEYYNYD